MKAMIQSAVMSCLLLLTPCVASAENPEPAEGKADAEKVYVIQTAGGDASGGGAVVTKLSIEDFHGIRCLVGYGVDGYMRGVKVRVPVNRVMMVMEYKNRDDWRDSVEAYEEEMLR